MTAQLTNAEFRGVVVFIGRTSEDIQLLDRFLRLKMIRFGTGCTPLLFSPKHPVASIGVDSPYYHRRGEIWGYPYKQVIEKNENISILFQRVATGETKGFGVTGYDHQLVEHGLSLVDYYYQEKMTPGVTKDLLSDPTDSTKPSLPTQVPETKGIPLEPETPDEVAAEEPTESEGGKNLELVTSLETDAMSADVDRPETTQIERAEHIDKIKGLIRDGQEALALQLVRSLNDPEIYEALLRDCCEISDYDEDQGWIQVSELFKEHDALFYQLLANAPEEANLPWPLRRESIEDIHLNHCASLADLDFLKHFIALKSFSIWGDNDDAADLNDISGLEAVPHLRRLQLNGLKSSPDWAPLQHLVQLRELALSGEKLAYPGPLVFRRLTKLKELSITCNEAVEMQGLSACNQLNSLTLNEAKSLRSLSFLESLESLRCLRIDGYGGDSLEGISKCRKITEFSISDAGELEDISELSSLSRLRELTLSGKFQNLDPLNALASLQVLYINDAKELRDVSGLSGCLGLERINLNGVSSLGSLWGIGQLKSLQELHIYSWESTSGYMDIHEVRELCNLRDLTISCSGRVLRGFPAVRHLKKLRSLDLSECNCLEVMDLSPLRGLSALNQLQMGNCLSITNLDSLSHLHQLETLELINCPRLASLAELRDIDHLQQLTITNNWKINDLDDLAILNGLTHLSLRYFGKLHDASGIGCLAQLEGLDLEGAGRLSDISFLDDLESLETLDFSCCHRIHPDDFAHLYENDFETLNLPDADEYEEEYEEDEEEENPWGERNLDDIPDDEWLRLYDKDQGSGLLQRAVGERWLDRVPKHIGTRKNLLAVEALHFAALNRDFGQIPDSLLTVENLLAEDADHHWNVFHFAAGYGSLDLLPDHLLVEKNLLVPTRADCPFFDNIFAGSTCLHIAAAHGVLTLLPRSILTTQNLLLKDVRGNTPLDKAEEGLQTLKGAIAELEENEAEQTEIDFHVDWLQTSQIQIDHLKQQVGGMPEETLTCEEPRGENTAPDELEPGLPQEDIDTADSSSSRLMEQPDSVEEDQQNGHNVCLFDDVMLDAEEDTVEAQNELKTVPVQKDIDNADESSHPTESAEQDRQNEQTVGLFNDGMLVDEAQEIIMPGELEVEAAQRGIDIAGASSRPTKQTEPVERDQHIEQAERLLDGVVLDNEGKAEQAGALGKACVSGQILGDQPDPRKEEVADEEMAETRISPLVLNTWFHSLDEAIHHPRAVAKLDIIHQENLENLDVLSGFPHLEELHFIKVNIDSFKGLVPVSKLCHIQLESCEVNGWMGLLDLRGLKKLGCFPGFPPEEVKRLLEDKGVEIYLFAPTRINDSKASDAAESAPETQMICEEGAIA